jgi:hypothetical protein
MSGSSNDRGSYRTTKANMMRAFDKLPLEVRRALADASRNYVPQPLLTDLRRGWPPSILVQLIEIWDRQELARDRNRKGADQ